MVCFRCSGRENVVYFTQSVLPCFSDGMFLPDFRFCLLLCFSSFTHFFLSLSFSRHRHHYHHHHSSFIIQAEGEYITDADAIPELPFAAWEPHAWARANYASRMQWLLTLARFGALRVCVECDT